MRADYSVNLKLAFVLGEAEVKKLSRVLSDRVGAVEYRASCSDDVTRNFTSIAELVNYENARSSQIKRLRLSARSEDYQKSATIDLSDSKYLDVALDLHGRDDVVDRLRAEVLDILSGMRPWYSVLHRIDFAMAPLYAILALFFGLVLMVALRWIPISKMTTNDTVSFARGMIITWSALALFFISAALLKRLRDKFFPCAVFLFGQGKKRFEHLERIHWGIGIAFAVSLLAGIVVAGFQWFWTPGPDPHR